jgi:UDP-GlcNAc:undecaprenyl-phosphate GlcNAc-1-phosphate transferase
MLYIELILIFILSLFLIAGIRKFAPALGLLDIPNNRSVHRDSTPRSAGIGFFMAVTVVLILFHFHYIVEHYQIFLAIFLVVLVGMVDDLHDISHNAKFVVLILGTLLLCLHDVLIDDLGDFFGLHIVLGWFALPFTIFAVVGFTNALNLIDGIDGLAASISIVILSGFWYVGVVHNDALMIMLSMAFVSALPAFLIFNWRPASIFMGDSGSLLLGFVISILAIRSLAYLPPIQIVFMIAIPVLDTLVVMVRRKRSGRPIFHADQCHMHHILKRFFAYSTPRTVIFLTILQAIYTFVGLHLDRGIDSGVLLILFVFNALLIYLGLSGIIARQAHAC